jgi:hypothetical protein
MVMNVNELKMSLHVLLVAAFVGLVPVGADAGTKRTFEADVRPIFKSHCFQCHGEESKTEGNLDVRLVRLLVAGGESGPAIVSGKAGKSFLIERLESGEMPPGEKKVSAEELRVIREWIDQGARTARPEPASADQLAYTEEERAFWSFQPVVAPPVPKVKAAGRVRTPVDAFVLERIEREGLNFSPDADKRTLIRRAYFDLLGLPPSPEDVDAFLADESPDAWSRLLDRLLASDHYGERWARHWLDVAGYADSDGYSEKDRVRESAYKFRDYVIRSFNADKPFDQFLIEQLAGDELVALPYRNLSDADKDRLTATGFLRNGPDGTADTSVDQNVARNEVVADTINIVSSSLLGLTVGCARCHNHRFDPITHVDYHRIRAIFEPAYDWKNWRSPEDRRLTLWSESERQFAEEMDAELAQAADERKEQLKQHRSEALDIELAKLPADVQAKADVIRDGVLNRTSKDRTPEQAAILKKYLKLDVGVGTIAQLYRERYRKELKEYDDRVASITARGPKENFVRALFETPGKVPVTHLFRRGSHTQPAEEVLPDELSILTRGDQPVVPANNPELETTGRRLAYARHLTNGKHPLTGRVLVNRIWMHHFGRGIVGTPSDFGAQGERPTHPELLDWLADHFVKSGWRLKTFHKLLMMSTVYRQSSVRTEALVADDPDNRLLGRANLRRLDAETIRDTVLAVSGNLNATLYGPPMPVTADGVGQVVIGTPKNDREGRVIALKGNAAFRRSIYVQARRTLKLGMLEAFDAPTMTPNCEQRNSSTVASQSLLFMNNAELLKQSEIFAERVVADVGNEVSAQVRRAWRLALVTEPTAKQIERSVAFLAVQKKFTAQRISELTPEETKKVRFAKQPEKQALATFCQFLLSNNAFLYVD